MNDPVSLSCRYRVLSSPVHVALPDVLATETPTRRIMRWLIERAVRVDIERAPTFLHHPLQNTTARSDEQSGTICLVRSRPLSHAATLPLGWCAKSLKWSVAKFRILQLYCLCSKCSTEAGIHVYFIIITCSF